MDGVHHIGGMAVVVEFGDGVALEVQPVGLFGSALVPALVQLKLTVAALDEPLHLLLELLLLVGVDALGELLQRQSLGGQ